MDIEAIKAVLKPFAEIGKQIGNVGPERTFSVVGLSVEADGLNSHYTGHVKSGDLRRAAKAYATLSKPLASERRSVLEEAAEIARAEQRRQLSERGNNELDEAWQIHNYGAVVSANIYDAIRNLTAASPAPMKLNIDEEAFLAKVDQAGDMECGAGSAPLSECVVPKDFLWALIREKNHPRCFNFPCETRDTDCSCEVEFRAAIAAASGEVKP